VSIYQTKTFLLRWSGYVGFAVHFENISPGELRVAIKRRLGHAGWNPAVSYLDPWTLEEARITPVAGESSIRGHGDCAGSAVTRSARYDAEFKAAPVLDRSLSKFTAGSTTVNSNNSGTWPHSFSLSVVEVQLWHKPHLATAAGTAIE